jgi:hypothetical protein
MKWIFESESERRDYLHNRNTSQCNDFCAINNYASPWNWVRRLIASTQIHTISKQPAPRLATRDNHCFRLKYSVSHFIDCDAVARRLCVSLIASGNTADEMGKFKKHECNQT